MSSVLYVNKKLPHNIVGELLYKKRCQHPGYMTGVPIMEKTGKGKIINIASDIAKQSVAMMSLSYVCIKGAIYTLIHAIAHALGPKNIYRIFSEILANRLRLASEELIETREQIERLKR